MGQGSSELVDAEKTSWAIGHTLGYNQAKREGEH